MVFSQNGNGSFEILSKIDSLRADSKLDSVLREVRFYSGWYSYINKHRPEVKWFYLYQDTIRYDSKFGIGQVIIDPFLEFNGLRFGKWTSYYSTGQIYSQGNFKIAATIYCTPSGPLIQGYSFKSGNWKYMTQKNEIAASGTFKFIEYRNDRTCEDDAEIKSVVSRKWRFLQTSEGKKMNINSLRYTIENGYW